MSDDIRDFGVSVTDVKRLNDRYHALAEAFNERALIDGDEQRLTRHVEVGPDAGPDDLAWKHRCDTQDVAVAYIRSGIIRHGLSIWIMTSVTSEHPVDPYKFVTVPYHMVTTGTFLTDNYPKGPMEHRPLWVKNTDWQAFFDAVMAERYGAETLAPKSTKHGEGPTKVEIEAMIRTVHAEGSKGRKIPKAVRANLDLLTSNQTTSRS